MIRINKIRNNNRILLSLLLLGLGLVAPFIGMENVYFSNDEAFQSFCCRDYLNAPMGMLSFYIGHLWTGWFGDEVLNLRILMVLCYEFSIVGSCIYLYKKQGSILLSAVLLFLMALSVKFTPLYLYNWDTGAYPFMTLYTIALLSYTGRRSLTKIAVVGGITALMVLSRIPTLASLLLTFTVIIISNRVKGKGICWKGVLSDSIVGLLFFFIIVYFMILIMTGGNPHLYIESWNPDNVINGHFNRAFLIYRFQHTITMVIAALAPIVLAYLCSVIIYKVGMRRRMMVFGMTVSLFLITGLLIISYLSLNRAIVGVSEGFYLLVLITPWLYNQLSDRKRMIPWYPLLVITGCGAVAMVGSDGFMERLMTVNTIPLLMAILYLNYRRFFKIFLYFSGIVTVAAYLSVIRFQKKDANRDYTGTPHLTGLHINAATDYLFISATNELIDSLRKEGKDFAAFGSSRFPNEYIYHCRPSYNMNHFHYFDTPEDVKYLKELTERYEYIFDITLRDSPESRKVLKESGYEMVAEREGVCLFRRRTDKIDGLGKK